MNCAHPELRNVYGDFESKADDSLSESVHQLRSSLLSEGAKQDPIRFNLVTNDQIERARDQSLGLAGTWSCDN